jgi:Flp pilus assembly pilin Flp
MKMSLAETGQGMVEYAFIIILVGIVVIAAVTLMGPVVGRIFSTVNSSL